LDSGPGGFIEPILSMRSPRLPPLALFDSTHNLRRRDLTSNNAKNGTPDQREFSFCNLESSIIRAESSFPHSEFRISHSEFRISHSAFRIPHSTFHIPRSTFAQKNRRPEGRRLCRVYVVEGASL
jgi:hypothetical protein